MSYRRLRAVFLMFFLMGQVVSLNAQTPGSERDSYFSDVLQMSCKSANARERNGRSMSGFVRLLRERTRFTHCFSTRPDVRVVKLLRNSSLRSSA